MSHIRVCLVDSSVAVDSGLDPLMVTYMVGKSIIVLNKIDLLSDAKRHDLLSRVKQQFPLTTAVATLSCKTNEGIPEFWSHLQSMLQNE